MQCWQITLRLMTYLQIARAMHDFQEQYAISLACSRLLIRDFTIGRREGSENVASKMNLCSFGLYRDYSNSLTSSNVGEPSLS